MGGKARSLARLRDAGFRVPAFFVVGPEDVLDARALAVRCLTISPPDRETRFAVRSSAEVEDGARSSYAGMFESFLYVDACDVAGWIERVRESGVAARVGAYASLRGERDGVAAASAIVQVMIDADAAGIAFGRDPVDGSDRVVVAAVRGVGNALAAGECDGDTYRVTRDERIVERTLVEERAALSDASIREIAAAVRAAGARFGDAQDVEWAIAGGALYLLQSRPVTTPPGIVWDNSNISESYGGIVAPLTFSFVSYAYAGAYRQLMRALAIPERTIDAHGDALRNMLGLCDGRMYYHLLNWYRLLALVPGFRLNRTFMESMMGVAETLPEDTVRSIESTAKARDALAAARTIAALAAHLCRLRGSIRRFHRHIDRVLAQTPALEALDLAGLDAEYARLEACLLTSWQAPLVNDFFAMVFYGVLRRLTSRWCADSDGSIQNGLLCAEGGMISTEPAARIAQLAALARGDDGLLTALEGDDRALAADAIAARPAIARALGDYLERFGDRCQSELKLESLTLHDDPQPLFRGVARLARGVRADRTGEKTARAMRDETQERVAGVLRAHPLRRAIFAYVLAQTRARVRDRENLRFERTRVFARVRAIFAEAGRRFAAAGYLDEARDVFFLEVREVLAAIEQPERRCGLARLAAQRRAEYGRFEARPSPPDRFTSLTSDPPAPIVDDCSGGSRRTGTGCCPGVVRGRVRVVRDPATPLEAGEILVAERTDPGWIVLFPAASGILVERGSVLSHAAIVSREMGIPSIVGVPGLTRWLHDGDLVEFDGRGGTIVRLEAAVP